MVQKESVYVEQSICSLMQMNKYNAPNDLSKTVEQREEALAKLLPMQRRL